MLATAEQVYAADYRRRMIELLRAGRTPESLGRQCHVSAPSFCHRVRQADLGGTNKAREKNPLNPKRKSVSPSRFKRSEMCSRDRRARESTMNDSIRVAIRTLAREAEAATTAEMARAAAIATGALPVYLDIAGCLAITGDGEVLGHDWDTREVARVTDEHWKKLAYVSAAERYPELSALAPPRPSDAKTRPDGGGKGRQFNQRVRCGTCLGTGWIEREPR
jgi:hypothetical protein